MAWWQYLSKGTDLSVFSGSPPESFAPVFPDSGREVLRRWAMGTATGEEVADALEAMDSDSLSLK